MAIYKTQGTVHQIDEVETINARNGQTYRKQSIVLEETDDRGYENAVALRAFGDTVAETEGLREGETVDVTFAINAREYNGRWYNDLNIIHVRRTAPVQEERRAATRAKIDEILDGTSAPHGEDDLPDIF